MPRSLLIGVDFGGTNIKIGCVTAQGRVARRAALESRHYATPARFVDGLHELIGELCRDLGVPRVRVRGVGVGVPGLVDGRRGVIYRLVNVPGGWRGVALKSLLERRLHCRCAVENDANVMALGEWRHGAGRGTRHSVYLTLGTGVGGGLIIDGALLQGVSGSAGEIGHMGVELNGPRDTARRGARAVSGTQSWKSLRDFSGPRCGCGRRGCLEALIGTAAILRRARAARLAARYGGPLTPKLVSDAARAGDRAARAIWRDVGCYLGAALADVVNLLNPERIVIGGGVASAWPWFSESLRSTIRELAFEVPAKACRVVRAQLGDDAGVIGAAMLIDSVQRSA